MLRKGEESYNIQIIDSVHGMKGGTKENHSSRSRCIRYMDRIGQAYS